MFLLPPLAPLKNPRHRLLPGCTASHASPSASTTSPPALNHATIPPTSDRVSFPFAFSLSSGAATWLAAPVLDTAEIAACDLRGVYLERLHA